MNPEINNCPTCGQSIDKFARTFGEVLDAAIEWWDIEDYAVGALYSVNKLGIEVEIVSTSGEARYDEYGDVISRALFIIIKTDDGRYFRKEGYQDSYGSTEWDGDLYEVKPELKTITTYDRV